METTGRIPTTHAGSLPRPLDLAEMMFAKLDGAAYDAQALEERIDSAAAEVVAKQRACGLDFISDGEYSKPGFSTYVPERFSGFGGESHFEADDMTEFPHLAERLFDDPGSAHIRLENCVGPIELADPAASGRDVSRFKRALGDAPAGSGFMGTISPGQIAFNYPNQYYDSNEAYLAALGSVLGDEYRTIIDAGFDLQIDSPDLAMSAHCRQAGSSIADWHEHLPMAIAALNDAIAELPKERLRLHVCWGNYPGPHHKDVPLSDIVGEVLKANVGAIYVEGANPRHEHEWRVFESVELPADKKIILGVIDVKSNCIEHPQVVADRLVRLANVVGRDRVIAGTDCGFDTYVRFSKVDPDVAWRKLGALVEGAKVASAELW